MATRTVFVQETIDAGSPFSIDMPATAVTGHPYLVHPSPLAIFNNKDSGKLLRVRLANLRPLTGPNALSAKVSLVRISALTGGTDDLPDKMDSTNADLPSQVRTVAAPMTITQTAVLRSSMAIAELNATRALATLCAAYNGDSRSGMDSGEFVRMTGDADVTGHILREGQGIAVVYNTNSPTHGWALSLRMKNTVTGATYRYNTIVVPKYMSGAAIYAVFNGVGSGVVIEVEKMQIREIGTDEIVIAEYTPIDGILDMGCDDINANIVMADSADTLPVGVCIKKNCVTARSGAKIGGLITLPTMRKVSLAEPPYGPGVSTGPQVARRGRLSRDMEIDGDSAIVLREGQGFALFLRNAGAQVYHEATLVVDIEDVGGTVQQSYGKVMVGGVWRNIVASAVLIEGEWVNV